MRERLLRLYQAFRHPRNFLVLLVAFVSASFLAHLLRGYDADFGITNLALSVEASVASAVLMLLAEQGQRLADEARIRHGEMLTAVLEQTKALQELMREHASALRLHADSIERHKEHHLQPERSQP